jgi:hypothetical protein
MDISVGTCGCIDHMIRLLSLVWGMGMLAGAFTLGTCWVLQKWSGVMFSSNQWGFVCTRACVATTIHCKSCTAWRVPGFACHSLDGFDAFSQF